MDSILKENGELYRGLREYFTKFVYSNHSFEVNHNKINIAFSFHLENIHNEKIDFHPTAILNIPEKFLVNLKDEEIDGLVFHIGLAEVISYWKIACPINLEIHGYRLNEEQLVWWKELYYLGMQEFFYINGITPPNRTDFMNITSVGGKSLPNISINSQNPGNIIPIGGGKDSIVTLESLKSLSPSNLGLIVNPRPASTKSWELAGFASDTCIVINRNLDKKMLDLNEHGFSNELKSLNGHTPFSATLAFYTLLASYVTSFKNIALSNESSANESTVLGTEVNHQYSKTYKFERDFRSYVNKFVSTEFNYFSFLRPINELQIASIFSRHEKYFLSFKSCNVGSKTDSWCSACAKCLFTYIILSPFIDPNKLKKIFGKDLYADRNMLGLFNQLTGQTEFKPFECVGTIDEVHCALTIAIDKYYANGELPFLLEYYRMSGSYHPLHYKEVATSLMNEFNSENFLSDNQANYLKGLVRNESKALVKIF